FISSRSRHTRSKRDWSSDVCSSDLQNFSGNVVVDTIEGTKQVIAMGPVAALEIIKHLGTNGGGFLGANSATPIENPTIISNLIEIGRASCRERAAKVVGWRERCKTN